jgi:hypothetical protein
MKTFISFSKNAVTPLLIIVFSHFISISPVSAQNCCRCSSPDDPKAIVCITSKEINCNQLLEKSSNEQVKKLAVCETKPLVEAQCQKLGKGICNNEPTDEKTFSGITPTESTAQPPSEETKPATPPTLGIKIPGVVFSSNIPVVGGNLTIPWFAQYIAAIQTYLTGISIVAAAIMIIYGGFLYIVASSGAKVESGKTIIIDAVVGLFLVLGAVTILQTINPATVQPKALTIESIKPRLEIIPADILSKLTGLASASGYKADGEIGAALSSTGVTGNSILSNAQIKELATKLSAKLDIEPCILYAVIKAESNGKVASIGHDENVTPARGAKIAPSRLDLLRDGKKYSGATFEKPNLPKFCDASCLPTLEAAKGITNDDAITDKAPDYGLDWRFSHGIGLGQCTINPDDWKFGAQCKDATYGRGLKVGGKCFTLPILSTPEGSTECMVLALSSRTSTTKKDPCSVFCAWAGGAICKGLKSCNDEAHLKRKMTEYDKCSKGQI